MEKTPPSALPVQAHNIPLALTQGHQSLVWRWRLAADDRWKKPHYTPRTRRKASPTNPQEWGAFNEAVTAYCQGGWDGIGRAMDAATDNIYGVDLDKCRNPLTGEITSSAWSIIKSIDSYTEVSPSGTGIRVFFYGPVPLKLDGRGNKLTEAGIEVYGERRFLTLTGVHVAGTPTTVEE